MTSTSPARFIRADPPRQRTERERARLPGCGPPLGRPSTGRRAPGSLLALPAPSGNKVLFKPYPDLFLGSFPGGDFQHEGYRVVGVGAESPAVEFEKHAGGCVRDAFVAVHERVVEA